MEHLNRIEEVTKTAIGRVSIDKLSSILELRVLAIDFLKKKNIDSVNRVLNRISEIN